MYFVTELPVFSDCKGETYNLILVIVDQLIKIVHDKTVKITINLPSLLEVILDVIVRHHRFCDSSISNRDSVFTPKFWSLLYYFPKIKRSLFTTFDPQIDD